MKGEIMMWRCGIKGLLMEGVTQSDDILYIS